MNDPTDELYELMNPVPEAIKKVFPDAKVIPMTKEEIKKYTEITKKGI